MVDDHLRHGFPRADGSAKPHESLLSLWEEGGERDVRKGRALLIVSHFCKAQ